MERRQLGRRRRATDRLGSDPVADNEYDLGIGGIGPGTRIGEGGSAVVYRARQDELDRDVAVKVLGFAANDDVVSPSTMAGTNASATRRDVEAALTYLSPLCQRGPARGPR